MAGFPSLSLLSVLLSYTHSFTCSFTTHYLLSTSCIPWDVLGTLQETPKIPVLWN
jgi:hypothetical protein